MASFDRNGCRGRFRKSVVADPFEIEFSAFGRNGEESDERVGGNRRKQIGAENLLAIIAAGEARDDIARYNLARGGVAVASLHDVRHQRLDLDDVAAFCLLGDVDQCGSHQITSSVQAASVTTTSAVTDHSESSDRRAIAVIF